MDDGARRAWSVLLLVLIGAIVATGVDFLAFSRRLRQGDAYAFVNVRKYEAVSDGNGKYHFTYVGHAEQPCVRALVPHLGAWPCWWVRFERDEWTR